MEETLVSIIVPCYNQAQYLPEALHSVLAQTYSNWECIIVNDGSPDNTETVAKEWVKKDERFKYLKKENGGLSSARNEGVRFTSGEYILPLDADDKIGNNYIEKAIEAFENNCDLRIVYGEAELFGEVSGKWNLPPYSIKLMALRNVIYCSAFFRRMDFESYGGYDETFMHGWEDWDLWLGILQNGGEVLKLPDIHFYYRQRQGSMVTKINENMDLQILNRSKLYSNHSNLYIRLFGDPLFSFSECEILKEQLEFKNETIKNIYQSNSFRLGNILLRPLKLIFNRKKKLKLISLIVPSVKKA